MKFKKTIVLMLVALLSLSSLFVFTDDKSVNDASDGFVSTMPSGTDLNTFWEFDTTTGIGPFGCFYGAVNRYDGANADDSVESRLSTEKGAIGYILNPNDWTRTLGGNTFTNSQYNTMLIIPPVYWYSELDSEGGSTGKLYMANTPDAFPGKTLVDYAHTYTSGGVVGHAPAIGIGVYKGMTLHNSVTDLDEITSVRLGEPTTNVSLADWVTYSNNASVGNNNGTYQVCNFYQWTLYKLMCHTILGNMDSQYMMGSGLVYNENLSERGTYLYSKGVLSSPYVKSTITTTDYARASPVSLLIENPWGGVTEYIGDMTVDSSGNLSIGNTLGGVTDSSLVHNALTITVPANVSISGYGSDGYINTFNSSSEVFGLPSSLGSMSSPSSPGTAINDTARVDALTNSVPSCTFVVSGGFTTTQSQISEFGLSSCHTTNLDWSTGYPVGARLGYVFEDDSSITSEPFAYIMDYNTNGTISDIRVNPQGKHIVQIDVNDSSYGTVSSTLMSIDDGTSINVYNNEISFGSTIVVATPTPESSQYRYEFDTWTGLPSNMQVTENLHIVANFNRFVREYDVSFVAEGPGTLSETSLLGVPYGTAVSSLGNELTVGSTVVTATPVPSQMGYTATLDYWNHPFTITSDTTIFAHFSEEISQYTVTIEVNNPAYGTVSESSMTVNYDEYISGYISTPYEGVLQIGSSTVYANANPTSEYVYEFIGWNGIPAGSHVVEDCTITAEFSATVNYVSVGISVNNSEYGSVSDTSLSVPYGSTISVSDNTLTFSSVHGSTTVTATPSQPTPGHTYEFNYWSYSSSEITSYTDIMAYFSEIVEQCTLQFVPNNAEYGTVSGGGVTVLYGSTISIADNVLTIYDGADTYTITATASANTPMYRYSFDSWGNIPGNNTIVSSDTIYANFTRETITYNITIYVSPDASYGTVSESSFSAVATSLISASDNVLTIGDTSIVATPTENTAKYTYVFESWNYQGATTVESDMTIYANFTRTLNMYTITIMSNNSSYGSVSETSVTAGYDTVIRPHDSVLQIGSVSVTATPEPQTAQYTYSLYNWTYNNQPISTLVVTHDITIVAKFVQMLRSYNVYFDVDEAGWGTVSPTHVSADYGAEISYSDNVLTIGPYTITATPSDTTSQYVYTFDSWVNIPSGNTVSGTATITAKFNRSDVDYEVTITAGSGGSVSESRLVVPYGTSISANGNILSVGSTTVTATPNNNTAQYTYSFGAWEGVPVGGIITGHTSVNASFNTTVNEYTVTITVNQSTWGTVSPTSVVVPYGTSITTDGTTMTIGSTTVTATPIEDTAQYDYGFRYWLSNYQPVHGTSVTGNMEIVANFYRDIKQYTVSVEINEIGWGTVSSSSVTVDYGTEINPVGNVLNIGSESITATPSQSDAQYVYDFGTWNDVPASRVVNGDMTITAVFTRSEVDYEVLIIAGEGGTVSQNRMVVPYGTTVSITGNILTIGVANITATPNDATAQYTYSFAGWTGVPNGGTIVENTSITAQFSSTVNEYTVSIRVNESEWGSISQSSVTVPYGTSISTNGTVLTIGSETITATPTEDTAQYDYEFLWWLYNFQPVNGVTVVGNMQIDAGFSRTVIQYTVTIAVNESGWGTVSSSSVTVDYGTEINPVGNVLNIGSESITATPSQSDAQYVYDFGTWNDVPASRVVNGDMTITAVFTRSEVDYEVLIIAGEGGTVSQNRMVVPYGTTVSITGNILTIGVANITATPNDATAQYTYSFAGWTGVPNGGTIVENTSINAVFNIVVNQYTVSIRVNEDTYGTVSESSVTVDYGTSISANGQTLTIGSHTITATPTNDTAQYSYDFLNWSFVGDSVNRDMTARAYFSRTVNQYTVSIDVNESTWGSVSNNTMTVDYGTPVSVSGNRLDIGSDSIEATPSATTVQYVYTFTEWLNVPVEITEDVTITAVFGRSDVDYEVSVSVEGFGTVSVSRFVVPYGTSISASGTTLNVGGASSVATPNQSTAQYTYSFTGWNGIPPENIVTDHVSVIAVFSETINQYTVSISVNEDTWGSVSETIVTVDYGTPISTSLNNLNIGSNTVSATATQSTAQYTYSFTNWVYSENTVTSNMDVVAYFTRTVNQYTVSIVANDITWGSVSRGAVTVDYGTVISSEGNTLNIGSESVLATQSPSTAQYSYSFVGWNNIPQNGEITASVTVTAEFLAHLNEYVVTINAESGGTVSESRLVVPYGTPVVERGNHLSVGSVDVVATPNDDTVQYTYEFRTWSNVPSDNQITQSVTITAEFDTILNIYTVSIQVNNSEYGQISSESVSAPYGTDIVRNENTLELGSESVFATPSPSTAQYTYALDSWLGPNRVTGDTVITAQFIRTVNQYTITIVSENIDYGSVSRSTVVANYGTSVSSSENRLYIGNTIVTATPSPATSEYVYIFDEWSNVPSSVTGDTTISASFLRLVNSFIVTILTDGNGTVSDTEVVVPYGTSITPYANELRIGVETVIATPNEPDAQYTNYFGRWADIPSSERVTENIVVTARFVSELNQYTVTFEATGGGTVSMPSAVVDYGVSVVADGPRLNVGGVIVYATPQEADVQYTYSFRDWSAPDTIRGNTTIVAYFTQTVNRYTVTFISNDNSYGSVSVPSITAGYGAVIQIVEDTVSVGPHVATAIPSQATSQYTYYFTDWTGISSGDILTSDMTVTANFSRFVNDYSITISTIGNGSVSSELIYAEYGASVNVEGDRLVIGMSEVLATPGERTQQYSYYFNQWLGLDDVEIVTEDMEITAEFLSVVNQYTLYISSNDVMYGTVSQPSITVDYGTAVSVVDNILYISDKQITATPSESTVQYRYEFVRWDNVPSEITMDIVGHAIFSREVVTYTVSINVTPPGYGSVSQDTVTVPYGSGIFASNNTLDIGRISVVATPSSQSEGYNYFFDKWVGIPNDNVVVSDMVITAVFYRELYPITVTFHATDFGSVSVESIIVTYGTGIQYNDNVITIGDSTITATPNQPTAQYTYSFNGWTGIVSDVITEDTVITAQFIRTVNQYTVSVRINEDYGTVSAPSVTVDYGTGISVDGQNLIIGSNTITATPYEDTPRYSYSFDRWDVYSSEVRADMTVTAVFSRTIEMYIIHITVVNPDYGTVSKDTIEADYGTPVRIDGNRLTIGSQNVVATPTESTEDYVYTFGEWLDVGDSVTSDMEITAIFHRDLIAWAFSIISLEDSKSPESEGLFKTVLKIIPILILGVFIYIGASRFIRSNGDSDYDSDDDYY